MNFLDTALQLHANGYKIIPIPGGSKRPVEDAWEGFDLTELDIRRFAERRYKNGNIGILTEHTPAVDLDIYNADLADEMCRWVERQFGDVVRVGSAPKKLLVFRTDKPFRKLQCVYNDGKRDHGVEILGLGQQFVAYGRHPDGFDYTWTSLDEPLTLDVGQLPSLSAEEADTILDKFEELATARGWVRKRRSGAARELGHDEDAFERFKPVLAISTEKVLDTLDDIPNEDEDYDTYLKIGCALHHQFKGEEEGLKLWHEWAEKSTKYDAADLNRRWNSFGHGPDTATFASLMWMANENRRKTEEKAFEHAIARAKRVATLPLLQDVKKSIALAISTDFHFDVATKTLQDRTKELTEVRPRAETIRKELRALMPKPEVERVERPEWCDGWVFVRRFSQFFNTETGEVLSRQAFDLGYGKYMISDDGTHSGMQPSAVALDMFGMQQVSDYTYLPGDDRIVQIGRLTFVNKFNQNSMPTSRAPSTGEDFKAINVMKRHFDMLIPEKVERELLLDWIAYCVQFPREKITWTPVLYSAEGAGKSWMAGLLGCLLGHDNVRSIAGENLKEDKTSWAEGRKVVVVEEVRLHGNSRYDVLDKMKPYVANETVPVRRMHTDLYEIINVTNYLMFTNYEDALPLNRGDRRYFVIRCSLQTAVQIERFVAANPNYFTELFDATTYSGDVLLHWFETRRIADSFQPKGRAPHTVAKDLMREAGEADDSMSEFEELINNGDPELCDALLNGTKLRGEFGLGLSTRQFGDLVKRAGFAQIGKFRVDGRSSAKTTYYTRDFTPFEGPAEFHLSIIRQMLDPDGLG